MTAAIPSDVSARICRHMNEDHADAVLLYAQVLGQTPNATAATLVALDLEGMDLYAAVDGTSVSLRIPFTPPLPDASAAHHTLIDLLKQARQVRGAGS
ncbi:MAG: DUF2470 domain-containing protein [Gloeomargaritaceae cyanobacterium C42_A2020_066]|nr:DUF2470 domain-containing protein [Gloeomargaritaceae cyanobacterium C42_A2020_066]